LDTDNKGYDWDLEISRSQEPCQEITRRKPGKGRVGRSPIRGGTGERLTTGISRSKLAQGRLTREAATEALLTGILQMKNK